MTVVLVEFPLRSVCFLSVFFFFWRGSWASFEKLGDQAYLRKMERKVFSLEESSGAFSGMAVDDMVRSGGFPKLTECEERGVGGQRALSRRYIKERVESSNTRRDQV